MGSAFAGAALGAFELAARELKEKGTFTFAANAMPYADASSYMRDSNRS